MFVADAIAQGGIPRAKIETLLEEEVVPDLDLWNMKIRLGLAEDPSKSPKKVKGDQPEEVQMMGGITDDDK